MGTDVERNETVTVDDRGRITLPKEIRRRFHLGSGDDLVLEVEDGEIHLRPDRPAFEPITSNKHEWGADTFLDAGKAMFGDLENAENKSGDDNEEQNP